jgi:hypothetical protein
MRDTRTAAARGRAEGRAQSRLPRLAPVHTSMSFESWWRVLQTISSKTAATRKWPLVTGAEVLLFLTKSHLCFFLPKKRAHRIRRAGSRGERKSRVRNGGPDGAPEGRLQRRPSVCAVGIRQEELPGGARGGRCRRWERNERASSMQWAGTAARAVLVATRAGVEILCEEVGVGGSTGGLLGAQRTCSAACSAGAGEGGSFRCRRLSGRARARARAWFQPPTLYMPNFSGDAVLAWVSETVGVSAQVLINCRNNRKLLARVKV